METAESRAESAEASQPRLRGFWSLFVTQFQGAFSDNILRNLVIFLMLGMSLSQARKAHDG